MKRTASILSAVASVLAVAFVPSAASGRHGAPSFGVDCDPFAISAPALSSARVSATAAAAGVVEPNVDEAYREALERGLAPATRRARASGPVRVPVFVHVIKDNPGVPDVPSTRITNQMTVLNDSFGGATGGDDTGFTFELIDTDVTINSAWSPLEVDTPEEEAMKTALREGGARSLNLYIVELQTLLGWATFPYSGSGTDPLDGVVVEKQSLPGGSAAPYNLGDTATHEVGHWLGLFHTFQGGCGPPGDFVDDTEPEATEHFGCAPRNTCPGGGNDPIENFMDYSDDICMDRFTVGQGNRVHDQTRAFRNAAPTTTNQAISTSGEAVAVNIAANDGNGDELSYAISDPPDHGTLGGTGAALTYTPTAGYGGPDSFAVRVTDIFGAAATSTISATVATAGSPPPGGSPPPSGGSPPSTPPLELESEAKAKQKLNELSVTASCGAGGCTLTGGGKILASGPGGNRAVLAAKTFKLKTASATAPANGSATLKLKLAKRKQRQLLALLKDGWKAKANVTVSATSPGGTSSQTTTIKVKR